MKASQIEKLIIKLKKAIDNELKRDDFNMVLSLVSVCANILYQTNIRYMDSDLEYAVKKVSRDAKLNVLNGVQLNDDVVLFWDGFGVNDRGLIQIYMKALCKIKRVVYLTYADRKDKIPDVQAILDEYSAERRYVDRNKKSFMTMIEQLNGVIEEFKPRHMFFYSVPDDVVALPLMYAYEGVLTRYQINLTDHAFWLGAGCCDKCINFRKYGAKISKEYRGIPKENNVVVPFYPIIHYEKNFQGYAFEVKPGQKIIFSGGALYKTLGEGNKYYIMVDHILAKHTNVIFWYAGSGDDSELKKIMAKYPERVYHTEERADLYQVLKHCNMYLSTYPMCGGLMFQYAAMAGIVPVTMKHGNISDEFLLDQKNINIEFETEDALYEEVDKLLADDKYAKQRSELMRQAVIAPEVFEEEIRKLVFGEESERFKTNYEHIDTNAFRQWYLEKLADVDIAAMLVRKNAIFAAIKHYPFTFLRGALHILKRKFL